jgi:hypothetical protein
MSQRIRGQEATIQVIVNGDLKGGSFARVTDFNLTPRSEIMESDFLGEVESDLDFAHHGYDFDFSLHEEDTQARDLLFQLVSAEAARERHPAINVVVTFAYRGGTTSTIVLQNCFLKMDSLAIGGRKDYVSNKFSGKCKEAAAL